MKNSLLAGIFIIISLPLFAQNILKGRLLPIPIKGESMFAFGLGYERVIKPKLSVQLLYNYFHINASEYDGGMEHYHSIIAEWRWYFKNAYQSKINGFFALYPQCMFYNTSGNAKGYKINGGLLIGISLRLNESWFLESYLGPRIPVYASDSEFKIPALRLGLNVNRVF